MIQVPVFYQTMEKVVNNYFPFFTIEKDEYNCFLMLRIVLGGKKIWRNRKPTVKKNVS